MPGLSGFEVLRRLKADSSVRSVPVIMVTAKGHERDVLSGLRGGAVDYIVKPFSLKELAARVELALRREPPATAALRLSYTGLSRPWDRGARSTRPPPRL